MRTTAQAQRTRAAARQPSVSRRGRSAPKPKPRQGRTGQSELPQVAVTAVRLLRVDEGLYVLRVGAIGGAAGEVAGLAVPAAHVSVPFADDGNPIEIVASYPLRGPWLNNKGGTLVLRSPTRGGHVIVTAYGLPGEEAGAIAVDLRRLDRLDDGTAATSAPNVTAATGTREVPTEILLHIERAGDRLFPGRGWVGALGRRMRIEAFSIRPLGQLAPADIEMKGFLPNDGETSWVPGGALCGTRGRGLPLTGFALRIAPQRADRFDVQYQGSFFSGGISELRQNGEPCRAGVDDPLEAINIRVVERIAEPQSEPGRPADGDTPPIGR